MNENEKLELINTTCLAGALAEIEVKMDETKEKENYISIKGAIQFGDSPSEVRRFEFFSKELTKKGEISKKYENAVKFANDAVPMTKDKENPTMVCLNGSLVGNDYVNASGTLVETTINSVSFFNNFTEYMGAFDIEGRIMKIADEVRGDAQEPTGRLIVGIVSADFYNKALVLKNLIVPDDIAEAFRAQYAEGQTAVFHVDYIVTKKEAPVTNSGGLGVNRNLSEGKSYVESVIVGVDAPRDEDEGGLSAKLVKTMLQERKSALDELKDKGYQGTKNSAQKAKTKASTSTSAKAGGVGKGSKVASKVESDDDFPF